MRAKSKHSTNLTEAPVHTRVFISSPPPLSSSPTPSCVSVHVTWHPVRGHAAARAEWMSFLLLSHLHCLEHGSLKAACLSEAGGPESLSPLPSLGLWHAQPCLPFHMGAEESNLGPPAR